MTRSETLVQIETHHGNNSNYWIEIQRTALTRGAYKPMRKRIKNIKGRNKEERF
ncbi:hypothetical protein KFK09_013611 [Dendrobium nobile]|uniref:Uncharacterized protein n=1 Tax=Dendrobium nobile TaxID=94219 RepID=A0A8T3BAN8_DENNO|nr:hypothetical protein KFK09_013611 [Dendrobium nobile]